MKLTDETIATANKFQRRSVGSPSIGEERCSDCLIGRLDAAVSVNSFNGRAVYDEE